MQTFLLHNYANKNFDSIISLVTFRLRTYNSVLNYSNTSTTISFCTTLTASTVDILFVTIHCDAENSHQVKDLVLVLLKFVRLQFINYITYVAMYYV